VMVTLRLQQRPWRSSQDRYPGAIRGSASAVATWVEQTCLQLVLMSVIRVSRNVRAAAANFNRRVLQPAYLKAGWRDNSGAGHWTRHSLRHVFCTTALFTWKLDPTDVSRMAGTSRRPPGGPLLPRYARSR